MTIISYSAGTVGDVTCTDNRTVPAAEITTVSCQINGQWNLSNTEIQVICAPEISSPLYNIRKSQF